MEHTMDTTYILPIPIHQTLGQAGAPHYIPLPFRRELDQTTEITAENSTPYTPTPLKSISRLESLPCEVRSIVWEYVVGARSMRAALEGGGPNDWYGPKSTNVTIAAHDDPWYPWGVTDREDFNIVMSLNKDIQDELLNMLCGVSRVRISHHLSNRSIFFDYRAYTQQLPAVKLQRMIHPCWTFKFLRHVYLGRCHSHYDEKPHSLRISRTQIRRPIVRRAESIRFIADHCPLLVSLQVVVTPWPRDNPKGHKAKRAIRFCELEPIIFGLQYVAQKCSGLETLRAVTPIWPCEVRYGSVVSREPHAQEEIRGLNLADTPIYLRDELIQAWAETTLRKVIEHGTEDRHLFDSQYDLWREFKWNLVHSDWQAFRTTVLGQHEFEEVTSVPVLRKTRRSGTPTALSIMTTPTIVVSFQQSRDRDFGSLSRYVIHVLVVGLFNT